MCCYKHIIHKFWVLEIKCENPKDLFKKSQVFKYVTFNGVPGKYFFAAHVK